MLRRTLPLLALALAACTAPTREAQPPTVDPAAEPEVPDPLVRRPWTTSFQEPALLFADRVRIEGPRGLLDHFAARTVDEYHGYDAETRPEGFVQSFTVSRPEAGVELRAYLDALELVVLEALVVVERPGDLDVSVVAEGDVYWRETASGREQRAARLVLEGGVGGPPAGER